jgi:hypothetical protein
MISMGTAAQRLVAAPEYEKILGMAETCRLTMVTTSKSI